MTVYHRYATVQGHRLFYREAKPNNTPINTPINTSTGAPTCAPTVVLLHGFPTSSFMFRDLVPALAECYHVIAPDLLGFGLSDAPSVDVFDYGFDALAQLTAALLDQLGVTRYAIYVQDYGAPVGWRLALNHPDAVTAIVTQNGNGYEAGFVEEFWKPVWEYGADQNPHTEAAMRPALGIDAIQWQYTHGVPDPSVVSPETWHHDAALVGRPGNDLIQLRLFADYAANRALYPRLHELLRESRVPLLAVWGRNDEIFGPAGALAFADDLPEAEIHLVDGGHFLLESALDEVAGRMLAFLDRVLLPSAK